MKYVLIAALTLLASFSVCAEEVYSDIGQQEILEASEMDFLIIDVRRPDEFEQGHVPNAINIPLSEIENTVHLFPQGDTPIVMYCRSGKRADKALNIMHERGYTDLLHLQGDMLGWIDAELPIEFPEE